MFISGLALVIDVERASSLLGALSTMQGVEVAGLDLPRGRVALVVESDHLRGEVSLAEQIAALPGVIEVDVAYHAFDEGPQAPTPLSVIAERLN